MSRKLAILAAILLGSAAFVWPQNYTGRVMAMTGPNSVMHSKALPNDGKLHLPYLPWSGTADSDVVAYPDTLVRKGDVLSGMWGGQRASATQPGHLMVTLTSISGHKVVNGQNVVNLQYVVALSHKWARTNGQDVWVSAGVVIPFITCAPGVGCPSASIPLP